MQQLAKLRTYTLDPLLIAFVDVIRRAYLPEYNP